MSLKCGPFLRSREAAFLFDPSTWPQSARDEAWARRSASNRADGNFELRSRPMAAVIHGEVEFTIYEEFNGAPLSIGTQPPMGDVRLPVQLEKPAEPVPLLVSPKRGPVRAFWSWVGGRWQWPTLVSVGIAIVRAAEYAVGLTLLFMGAIAAISKISHSANW